MSENVNLKYDNKDNGKFILVGQDKKLLAFIKNTLTADGHIFLGYTEDALKLLKLVRDYIPNSILIDIGNNFETLKQTLETLDDELLAACIIILSNKNKEIIEFLDKLRIVTYIVKPLNKEMVTQIFNISLMSYKRLVDYELKVKKLNNIIDSRKVIEKAKWILIEEKGYTEAQAYELIRKKSRDTRIPMKEIAEALILINEDRKESVKN